MDGRADRWMDGWMDERIDGWMSRSMDGWMSRSMDGWTDERIDGWTSMIEIDGYGGASVNVNAAACTWYILILLAWILRE